MQTSLKPNYPSNRTKGLVCQKRKITDVQADHIRLNYIHGHKDYGLRPLAEKYGVSTTAIWKIVREKSHVPENWEERPRCKEPRNAVRNRSGNGNSTDYSEADQWEICQQLADDLADEIGFKEHI